MSWKDDEIDDLFREAADQQYFEFRPEYFADIEKQLPVKRSRKPLFWWFASSMFLMVFMGWGIVEGIRFDKDTVQTNVSGRSGVTLIPSEHAEGLANTQVSHETESSVNTADEQISEENVTPVIDKQGMNALPSNPIVIVSDDQVNGTVIYTDDATEVKPKEETSMKVGTLPTIGLGTKYADAELRPSSLLSGKHSKLSLYVEAGGAIGQGWVATNPATINGDLFINGGLTKRLGRLSLSAGIGFRAAKLGDLQIMERTKIYGFGYSTYENRYTFKSIYSLELPLQGSYSFGRHAVSGGVTPSYNLCAGLTRTEWIDGVQTVQHSGVSNVGLFSKFGITGAIGYSYYVNEYTQIGTRVAVQCIEPLSSDRFVGSRVKLPVESQVFIRRTFELKR
jgi:hypothetical protein